MAHHHRTGRTAGTARLEAGGRGDPGAVAAGGRRRGRGGARDVNAAQIEGHGVSLGHGRVRLGDAPVWGPGARRLEVCWCRLDGDELGEECGLHFVLLVGQVGGWMLGWLVVEQTSRMPAVRTWMMLGRYVCVD